MNRPQKLTMHLFVMINGNAIHRSSPSVRQSTQDPKKLPSEFARGRNVAVASTLR